MMNQMMLIQILPPRRTPGSRLGKILNLDTGFRRYGNFWKGATILFLFSIFFSSALYAADQPKGPMKISADTALEWHRDDHQYIARGNVVITQDDMTLMADQVVADYHDKTSKSSETSDEKSSGMKIYRLTATGKTVTLKTATETATGTKAVYDKTTNLATVEGPVTITRGKDILRGTRATVDLTTKKSTLLGDPKSGGRVTGVFYTEEVKGK